MFQFSAFRKNTDSLIAAAAGFLIIFLFTRHGGIGIDPDGMVYLDAAKNLHQNGRLIYFLHDAVVDFPALYPLFLSSIIRLTGLNPLVFAPYLNPLLFGLIIFLSGQIMELFAYQSKWYKRALLTCIVLSPCLLEVYSMLWSETLFIVFLLLFFTAMHRYFESYSRKMLITAALLASLASVTRYAGITIIATGGILLLLDMKLPLRKKITDAAIYAILSPVFLIINLARNRSISGTMTGMREKSIRNWSENTRDAGSVIYDWTPFLHGNYATVIAGTIILIAGLFFLCARQFWHHRRLSIYENMAAFFSLFYLLFIIVSSSISRFEPLNSRLLSPLFIPLLWCGSNWMVAVSQNASYKVKKLLLVLAIIIFISFQHNQLAADYETWDGVKDAGIPGYTENQWKYSATVMFIQKDSLPFQKGHTIYSNAYDAIYFFTGRPGKFLPHKEFGPEVQGLLDDRHCYVVWFNDGDNPDLVSMDFITRIKKMKLLKQFNDGAIYGYDE